MLDNFKKFIKGKNTKLPYEIKDVTSTLANLRYGDMFSNTPETFISRSVQLTSPTHSDENQKQPDAKKTETKWYDVPKKQQIKNLASIAENISNTDFQEKIDHHIFMQDVILFGDRDIQKTNKEYGTHLHSRNQTSLSQ